MRVNYFQQYLKKLKDKLWPICLIYLYALALALAKAITHEHIFDLGTDDEASYLHAGTVFFQSGPPSGEFSPLYALWYWLESCFIRDNVMLYQANWGILTFAILLSFLVAIRAAGVGIVGAGLALSLVSVTYYFDIWPYVTMLSTALVLLAAFICLRVDSPVKAYSAASAMLAIAVYVRPELFLTFLLILGVAFYVAYQKGKGYWVIIPVLIIGILWASFGTPLGGARSMMAFGQHYALKVVQARHLDIDPWNNYKAIVKSDFGEASTPFQALASNPRAFLWSVAISAKKIPQNAVLLGPYFPQISDTARIVGGGGVFILLGVGAIFGVKRARCDEKGKRLIVLLLALLVPYLISALLIYPRYHYALAPLAVLGLLAGYGLSELRFRLAAKLLFLLPLPFFYMAILCVKTVEKPILETSRIINSLPLPARGRILEPDYGRALFANLDYVRLSQTDCIPLNKCMSVMSPTIIVSDDRLRAFYAGDKGFQNLIDNPANAGYDFVHMPESKVDIYFAQQ